MSSSQTTGTMWAFMLVYTYYISILTACDTCSCSHIQSFKKMPNYSAIMLKNLAKHTTFQNMPALFLSDRRLTGSLHSQRKSIQIAFMFTSNTVNCVLTRAVITNTFIIMQIVTN